jgi:hypothetical protein
MNNVVLTLNDRQDKLYKRGSKAYVMHQGITYSIQHESKPKKKDMRLAHIAQQQFIIRRANARLARLQGLTPFQEDLLAGKIRFPKTKRGKYVKKNMAYWATKKTYKGDIANDINQGQPVPILETSN